MGKCLKSHDKIYENSFLCSDPPQKRWICRKCGAEGTEIVGQKNSECYEDIKLNFKIMKALEDTEHKFSSDVSGIFATCEVTGKYADEILDDLFKEPSEEAIKRNEEALKLYKKLSRG